MKSLVPRHVRMALFAVVILTGCLARAGEPDQILFVHLKIHGDAITCLESTARPGRLKSPSATERKGTLYLELVSTNGVPIWSEVMADPAVRRLEYEDPDHPGTLKIKEVNLTESEFTVRVPVQRSARTLRVHRLEKPLSRSEALAQTSSTQPLGTVTLPRKETAR